MQTSKCLKCGNPALIEQLCKDCYLDSYHNVIGFKNFNLSVCILCGSYNYGKEFRPAMEFDKDFLKTIKKAFYENTKFHKKPESYKVDAEFPQHEKKQGNQVKAIVNIHVKTKIGEGKYSLIKEENYNIPLRFRYSVCDRCSRGYSKYFEVKIQLRNRKNFHFNEVVSFVRAKVKERKGVFITKEEELRDGIDFYVTSQKFVQTIGSGLTRRFAGDLKVTSSLHTRDWKTSKDLYRVDVVFRLGDFNVGDILKINHKFVLVKSVAGMMVSGVNIKQNNCSAQENYKTHDYEIIAKADDAVEVIVVKKTPQIEVLHPETYQPIKIENPKNVKIEEKIKVILINERVYAVSV